MSEALQEVVNFLNSMVANHLIRQPNCEECGYPQTRAVPAVIDLDAGIPGTPLIHEYRRLPRWECERCHAWTPVSTDDFLMALDFRADAVAYQSTRRRPIYTNFPV